MSENTPTVPSTVQRIKIGSLRQSAVVLAPGTYRDGDHAVIIKERHRVMRIERFGYEDRRCDSFAEERPGQWGSMGWHVSHYDWTTAERIDPPRKENTPSTASASSLSWWRRLLAFLFRRQPQVDVLPEARVVEREGASTAASRETA